MTLFTFNVIKILFLAVCSATVSLGLSPIIIKLLYKFKFWKKEARQKAITGEDASVFYSLHKENETRVPRGGGIIIWLSTFIVIFTFFILSNISNVWWVKMLNFLSRPETWLPLFALISASLLGLFDDFLTISSKGGYIGGGMSFKKRLFLVALIGLIGGLWFYFKLDRSTIHIPLIYNFPEGINIDIGIWYIPLFVTVMLAAWSGGIIDGIDGLAGGVFASIFGAFTIIAFAQGQINLAAFCAVILGTLFSFLWFNIPPAQFYMGETGILGLTSVMTVAAFLTDSVVVLPIIALPIVATSASVILQILSKKFLHKKIWLSTPIHHHFEAKGWPSYKVTMRFWIIGIVFAILGVAIRLLDQGEI
jgi:phospho-N-acetylmuramoyl-pentapeptide-transferase